MTRRTPDEELAYVRSGIGSDLDTMLVFNLLRTHSQIKPFLEAGLGGDSLTAAQLNALLVLRAAEPHGMLMSEIGRKLVVTRSNVTGLVDRLERRGLVVRADHADRRATVVRLTREGAGLLESTVPAHARMLAGLTACLTDRQKQTLIRLLTTLRRGLRRRGKEDA